MKVRVRDIAARAGVSPATVSNALNGRPGVSKENTRHILKLAEEMGYVASKAGKNAPEKSYIRLVMFKRHGLVVMDTQFFMELVEAVERECQAEGHELIITHIHTAMESDYRERIRAICAEQCAGILLLGTEMYTEDLELFSHCASPLVALDNLFRHEQVHAVVMNNYDAGYQATNALYAAGHRRIGHITSKVEFSNMRYRRKGFEAALREHDLAVDDESLWRVTPTLDGAYRDMRALLDGGRVPPTGFFAGNDIMAVGCMRALSEKGYVVPQDVSLIGMDDVSICQFCTPPLSTIRVYRQDMGTIAVRTLLSLVGRLKYCTLKTEMSVSLVERGSVAPPRLP
ncbi:MAG: LacI family DNA-binding transcriptional regulator [Candidatus Limiplasma sp.]|nr:LacI family DNA-binding transcriptional regulator [Candidatus Limiplasma sp.]